MVGGINPRCIAPWEQVGVFQDGNGYPRQKMAVLQYDHIQCAAASVDSDMID